MRSHLIGIYRDKDQAERAIDGLVAAGLERDEISIVGRQAEISGHEPSGEGVASGAAMGGLTGLAIGLAALALPGVGPLFAAGPIAIALGGAGAGAIAGGLLGSLTEMGVDEADAQNYTEAVRQGNTLLLVGIDEGQRQEVEELLRRSGAIGVSTKAEAWDGWSGYQRNMERSLSDEELRRDGDMKTMSTETMMRNEMTMARDMKNINDERDSKTEFRANEMRPEQRMGNGEMRDGIDEEVKVPVVSEEIVVDKREVETGEVAIHQRVINVPVEEEVQLKEERVTVERRPVDRPAEEADLEVAPREIRVTEKTEEPIVRKRARVVEEVVVGKEVNERSQKVRDEVRRTEVEVEGRSHRERV